jgi:hypothetical protein
MADPPSAGRPDRAPYQNGLTIITPVIPGREEILRQTLQRVYDDVETNDLVPFLECDRIHFARWVILDGSSNAWNGRGPPILIFSTNFDEPVDAHLAELYDRAAAGLDLIYGCCEGYPAPSERSGACVLAYLRAHRAGYDTLYVGTRGLTVLQIRREAALRDAIEGFLDELSVRPDFATWDVSTIRRAIQELVRGREDLRWALEPPPERRRAWPYASDLSSVAVLVLLFAVPFTAAWYASQGRWLFSLAIALGTVVVALAVALAVLRYKEKRDEQDPPTTDFGHVASLLRREDVLSGQRAIVQNQMSSVTNIKPGAFRHALLRTVLKVVDAAGRYVYIKGSLGDIPSIHFARWVIIDGGRRLLFFSNFDGSWENYLGDFIDKAASGLTAVWSNTRAFPRSRWLVKDGARDEQRFKAYARNSQTITEVWYSAYKYLTVQNIHENARIRAGLSGTQTASETEAWLRLF